MSRNRLSEESSPYLLQHKDNPVWWQPWGVDAFARAAQENKPIFLSVGYATCHWCHVMEKESFENREVGDFLNRHFVCVKVDREERPDVDDLYMAVVQQLTGRGGWPMSVWLTPTGEPFFGGTYFPRQHFMQISDRISELWRSSADKIREDAVQLTDFLRLVNEGVHATKNGTFQPALLDRFVEDHLTSFDAACGGFGGAPKFPQTMNLMVLMRLYSKQSDEKLKTMVCKTLDEMAFRGMYDHLAGGFHRYSTDERWIVSHFEKMLYDNALLAATYLEAYQLYRDETYKAVACETMDYVLREMTHPLGGFFSAQDADSEVPEHPGHKEEGYFCTFGYEEIKEALGDQDFSVLEKVFTVSKPGNFEGRNVLALRPGMAWKERAEAAGALEKMAQLRAQRPKPITDDKVLLAWNGLMIAAFAKGFQVTGQAKYLRAAQTALEFIQANMVLDGALHRTWRDGKVKSRAFCDDYASLIHALLAVYQCDFDERHLLWAKDLQAGQDDLFWSPEHHLYFRDSGHDPTVLSRVRDEYDGVTPSSNSLACSNLLRLYGVFGNELYRERAEEVFKVASEQLSRHPMARPQMLLAMQEFWEGSRQVVIACGRKPEGDRVLSYLYRGFFPYTFIGSAREGSRIPLLADKSPAEELSIYLCENRSCRKPLSSLEDLKAELSKE